MRNVQSEIKQAMQTTIAKKIVAAPKIKTGQKEENKPEKNVVCKARFWVIKFGYRM